jgi:hypothetical protein
LARLPDCETFLRTSVGIVYDVMNDDDAFTLSQGQALHMHVANGWETVCMIHVCHYSLSQTVIYCGPRALVPSQCLCEPVLAGASITLQLQP